jgi:hypothetical protein
MKRKNPKMKGQLAEVPNPESLVYCWRSECAADDHAVLKRLPVGEIIKYQTKRLEPFPDTVNELTVKTLTLEQLRNIMRKVEDGHVMVQTVQPQHLYTGERDDDLE